MQEPEQIKPATVPAQPEANAPMKKGRPVLYILVGVIALIGITNLSSFVSGKGKEAPRSAMPMRPSAANPQQVSSFQNQQALQTTKDQEDRARQQQVTAAQLQQMQAEQSPGPEADGTAPMTPAQRQAIYGNSPNAPKQTSNASQAQAEAKQRLLAREKQHQDALNSDTVAIDFSHQTGGPAAGAQAPTQTATAATDDREEGSTSAAVEIAQAADQENPQRPSHLAERLRPADEGKDRSDGRIRLRRVRWPSLSCVRGDRS